MKNNTEICLFVFLSDNFQHSPSCTVPRPLQLSFAAMFSLRVAMHAAVSENCCIAASSSAKLNTPQVSTADRHKLPLVKEIRYLGTYILLLPTA